MSSDDPSEKGTHARSLLKKDASKDGKVLNSKSEEEFIGKHVDNGGEQRRQRRRCQIPEAATVLPETAADAGTIIIIVIVIIITEDSEQWQCPIIEHIL